MNKKGMGYVNMLLLLTALTVGYMVTNIPDFSIEDFKSKINWTHIEIDESVNSPDLTNGLESAINGLGEAFFHFMKFVAQWSSENPQVPFKLLIYLVILAIFAPILIAAFKFSIIVFILTKEFIQTKKEKKLMKDAKR